MSKQRKLDFKALVAGAAPQVEAPPEPEPIVRFKPQRTAPVTEKAGSTLKQRAHQVSLYLEPAVYERLRDITHAERTKLHGLLMEGVDAVLRKRGQPSIRQLIKDSTP
jgi:hypothetical protein